MRTYKHLVISDSAKKVLDTVYSELLVKHPAAEEVKEALDAKLEYLNEYGGTVSDTDGRRRFKVTLYNDPGFPYCFSVRWERLETETEEYVPCFSGGLQCNAVRQAFGSVQVGEPQWWSIHT
jgi:hypothetical protein